MKFPDLEAIVALASSDYERDFLRAEFAPGLEYYVDRIDRLLFTGGRVLDAGCGAGQWSLALAQRFQAVDAVDLKPDRLAVLNAVAGRMGVSNVEACLGSLERLPYSDAAFDAVFCYGVIMFTSVEQVLAEFRRVLRPGGRVYLCLNADGWSRRLADRSSKTSSPLPQPGKGPGVSGNGAPIPPHFTPGLTALYTTYWHRAIKSGLCDALVEGAKAYPEGLLPWENRPLFKVQRRVARIARRWMAALAGVEWKRSVARDALCRSSVGRELLRRVRGFCGEEFVPFLLDDVAAFLERVPRLPEGAGDPVGNALRGVPGCGAAALTAIPGTPRRAFPTGHLPLMQGHSTPMPSSNRFGPTRAIRPEELADLAAEAGFVDFQWSVEADLACDWLKPAAPKYPGHYGDDLCVWECLLTRPQPACAAVSLQRHFDAARQAALAPVFAEPSRDPVLSNASTSTYPAPLVAHARWQGEMLGGATYMRRLARAIVGGETEAEQAVRRILRFVQKAVFRDPVVQPLLEDGSLPDGLTALLCARGRCGHTARILVELFQHAGLDARARQFPRHVVAEARCGDRWVVADADAFKGGIVPESPDGRLLGMDQIEADPYVLDRYPPTGWMMRPRSKHAKGLLGHCVRGYVDALEPDRRGFVSGYYVASAGGFPPSLPEIQHFEARDGRFTLSWNPAQVREGRLAGYRVRVGTRSRAWHYDDVFLMEGSPPATADDILGQETCQTCIEGAIPPGTARLFASVTAVSDRIDREPDTFFWPSEEVVLETGRSR